MLYWNGCNKLSNWLGHFTYIGNSKWIYDHKACGKRHV